MSQNKAMDITDAIKILNDRQYQSLNWEDKRQWLIGNDRRGAVGYITNSNTSVATRFLTEIEVIGTAKQLLLEEAERVSMDEIVPRTPAAGCQTCQAAHAIITGHASAYRPAWAEDQVFNEEYQQPQWKVNHVTSGHTSAMWRGHTE